MGTPGCLPHSPAALLSPLNLPQTATMLSCACGVTWWPVLESTGRPEGVGDQNLFSLLLFLKS